MKSLNSRTLVLVLIPSLALVCAPLAAAQTSTTTVQSVKVVNTTSSPVPTVAQGTTKISGNVNITNASLPVNGSVSITNKPLPVSGNVTVTNTPLPVTGTVTAGNLPLDSNGNVKTSVYPATATFSFTYVLAYPCQATGGSSTPDLCVYGQYNPGCPTSQVVSASTVLDTLGSQGFNVVAVTPVGNSTCIYTNPGSVAFTLVGPPGAGATNRVASQKSSELGSGNRQ
jgi:hypothetical protein